MRLNTLFKSVIVNLIAMVKRRKKCYDSTCATEDGELKTYDCNSDSNLDSDSSSDSYIKPNCKYSYNKRDYRLNKNAKGLNKKALDRYWLKLLINRQ